MKITNSNPTASVFVPSETSAPVNLGTSTPIQPLNTDQFGTTSAAPVVLNTEAPQPEPLQLADQKVETAREACIQSNWSLSSQLDYLKAAQDAVQTYQAVAPDDPKLSTLQQLVADTSRDVKSLAQQGVQAAYTACTQSNWSLDSQVRYLKAAQDSVRAYELASPADPQLASYRQLTSDLTRDVKNLAEQGVQRALDQCNQNIGSIAAKTDYLQALQAAVNAYRVAEPGGARLSTLSQLAGDTSRELISLSEKALQGAADRCSQNDWDLSSQLNYLQVAKEAIGAYRAINPNDPKVSNLQQLADGLAHDIKSLADENLREAASQNTGTLDSQLSYLKAAQDTVKAYEVAAPGDARLPTLRKLVADTGTTIKDLAEKGIQDAYKHCTEEDWDLASQQQYLKATQAAVKAYTAVDPGTSRLTTLRQLAGDIGRDVAKLQEAEDRLHAAKSSIPQTGWTFTFHVGYLNAVSFAESIYSSVMFQSMRRLQQLSDLKRDLRDTVEQLAKEGIQQAYSFIQYSGFSVQDQLSYLRKTGANAMSYVRHGPSELWQTKLQVLQKKADLDNMSQFAQEQLRRARERLLSSSSPVVTGTEQPSGAGAQTRAPAWFEAMRQVIATRGPSGKQEP